MNILHMGKGIGQHGHLLLVFLLFALAVGQGGLLVGFYTGITDLVRHGDHSKKFIIVIENG